MGCSVPSCREVGGETPLRVNMATALAFPDGSMSASGLRREAAPAVGSGARRFQP